MKIMHVQKLSYKDQAPVAGSRLFYSLSCFVVSLWLGCFASVLPVRAEQTINDDLHVTGDLEVGGALIADLPLVFEHPTSGFNVANAPLYLKFTDVKAQYEGSIHGGA